MVGAGQQLALVRCGSCGRYGRVGDDSTVNWPTSTFSLEAERGPPDVIDTKHIDKNEKEYEWARDSRLVSANNQTAS